MWRHLEWSPDHLRDFQEAKLRGLASWAAERVPFYRRRLLEHGVDPSRVGSLAELQQLPILEREELRAHQQSLIADGADPVRCVRILTSGSTGIPITMHFSRSEIAVRSVLTKRPYLLFGQPPWTRTLQVGNPREYRPTTYQRIGIFPETRVSAFRSPTEQTRVYHRCRAGVLAGYPSSLRILASALEREGGPRHSPRLVRTGGELLLPTTRQYLQQVFRAPVRDFFGAEEMGHIAWECPTGGGYHLAADCGIFEVVRGSDPVAPGEEGDLLLTSLFGRTMPLIRYRVGDRVVMHPDPCPCGLSFPRLERIVGRADDMLQLPDGTWVHPVVAACGVVDLPDVACFRIVQEDVFEYAVDLVRPGDLPSEVVTRIQTHFREHLGARKVTVRLVDEIPPDPSGKLRHIVCRIPHVAHPRPGR